MSKAAGQSACDYAFHMGVTRFDERTPEQLRQIVDDGTASFKIFLAYKGPSASTTPSCITRWNWPRSWASSSPPIAKTPRSWRSCSSGLLAEGKTGPEWHEPSRPPAVEAEGVHHLATFAGLTGAHVYIVHTSSCDALRAAQAAHRGVQMWVETVIPYLVLDEATPRSRTSKARST